MCSEQHTEMERVKTDTLTAEGQFVQKVHERAAVAVPSGTRSRPLPPFRLLNLGGIVFLSSDTAVARSVFCRSCSHFHPEVRVSPPPARHPPPPPTAVPPPCFDTTVAVVMIVGPMKMAGFLARWLLLEARHAVE